MTPETLLQHIDSGLPWPAAAGQDFTSVPAAYQMALSVRERRIARGEKPVGFKVGFTNRSIWPRYQVFAPIWGTVWDTTLSHALQGQGSVSLKHTCLPRIEPELVFGFKQTPAPGCGLQELYSSLDWLAPGFEIVQCHLPEWRFQAPQAVADSALHAHLLVGEQAAVNTVAADGPALHALLAGLRARLHQGTTLMDEGSAAMVLDSPLNALLHFVTELRHCRGAPEIQPGDVVTTGTWTDAWPVQSGQSWQVAFSSAVPALRVAFA